MKPPTKPPATANIGPLACYIEGKELLGGNYPTFLAVALVGLFIGGVFPLILMGPMFCGMALCLMHSLDGSPMQFERLFKGFDHFVPALIASLLYVAATVLVFIPLILVVVFGAALIGSDVDVLQFLGATLLLVIYAVWIYIATLASLILFFACVAIVDRRLDGAEAIKLAFDGCLKNFWGVSLAAFAGLLILIVATLMCIVPVFFASPIVLAGHFVLYRKIFGLQFAEPVIATVV